MQVRQLSPGQEFRVDLGLPGHYLDYRLVYVNECRAYVEPVGRQMKKITRTNDLAGEETLAEFSAPGGRVNIGPTTEVELLGMDDLAGPAPASMPAPRALRRGDREFPAGPMTRPVRPGTVRAKMLEALAAGETSVPAMCKKFKVDRNLLVAHVHEAHKCHGYGYRVVGDTIAIFPPVAAGGVEDLL